MNREDLLIPDNIKNITTLIELRWSINIHGYDIVSKILKVDIDKLELIKKINTKDFTINIKELLNNNLSIEDIKLKLNNPPYYKKIYEDDFIDDYFEFDYIDEDHKKALDKNKKLISKLNKARKKFLDIGTNKIKRRLNKLGENDDIALAIRIALEIEDKNIQAKKNYGKYRTKIYNEKYNYIIKLIEIFKKHPNWPYGIEIVSGIETNSIIYFEIPGVEQISWHLMLYKENEFPIYNTPWDGKENSTLYKIANKIKQDYNNIIY